MGQMIVFIQDKCYSWRIFFILIAHCFGTTIALVQPFRINLTQNWVAVSQSPHFTIFYSLLLTESSIHTSHSPCISHWSPTTIWEGCHKTFLFRHIQAFLSVCICVCVCVWVYVRESYPFACLCTFHPVWMSWFSFVCLRKYGVALPSIVTVFFAFVSWLWWGCSFHRLTVFCVYPFSCLEDALLMLVLFMRMTDVKPLRLPFLLSCCSRIDCRPLQILITK